MSAPKSLHLSTNPLLAFSTWFDEAKAAQCPEVNAMTLATTTRDGRPSARIVLLKGLETEGDGGFLFFTNYESRKGREILDNPYVALVFHWIPLKRQVRIEGRVSKTTPEESNQYFQTRPRGSQIGAWSSPQSREISSKELHQRLYETEQRFAGGVIPCPPFWGGFRLTPERIEFWEDRPNRVHERECYVRENSQWLQKRLAP